MPKRRDSYSIVEMVTDPQLLGDRTLSVFQSAILKAIYGLEMNAEERDAFGVMTEGQRPRRGGYSEATLNCGRRSGKSEKILANVAVYEAIRFDPEGKLAPGEIAYIPIVAQNVKGARDCRGYIEGKLLTLEDKGWEVLDHGKGQERAIVGKEIRLINRLNIAIFPCTKASVRGKGGPCALTDEIAHWQTEPDAYNADYEVMRAMRPLRATYGIGAKQVNASSPFGEEGVLWDHHQARKMARRLFVKAVTEDMNPAIDAEFLRREYEDDPEGAAREYGAQFGKAGGTYLPPSLVDTVLRKDRPLQLPPGAHDCKAQLDVAYKTDLFAWGIAHLDGERVVVDLLRWEQGSKRRPLVPREMAQKVASDLKDYGIDAIDGDIHCDVPMQNDLREFGIQFTTVAQTESTNMQDYRNLKAVMGRGQIDLPFDPMIRADLCSLIAKKSGNIVRIAAPDRKGCHDDISKVVSRLTMRLLPLRSGVDMAELNSGAMPWTAREWRKDEEREFSSDLMGAIY